MKEAGCRRVYLGLESGSQATLDAHEQAGHGGGGRPRRAPVPRGRHRGGRASSSSATRARRSPSIEETFELALTLPLDEISFNVPDAAARLAPVRAAGRARRGQGLDAARTRSPSSTPPRSTSAGCGAGSTRRWRRSRRAQPAGRGSPAGAPSYLQQPEQRVGRPLEEPQGQRAPSAPAAASSRTARGP